MVQNPYYSQCLPGAAANPAPVASPTTLVTKIATSSTVKASSAPSSTTKPASGTSGSGKNGAKCSINDAFKAHAGKKYIGVTADQGTLSNAQNKQVIIDNFGQVTPENRYFPLSPSNVLGGWLTRSD